MVRDLVAAPICCKPIAVRRCNLADRGFTWTVQIWQWARARRFNGLLTLASASDALVVLDNLGELQRDPRHEEALMLIYQSLYAVEGEMLVCHDQSARGVEFDLPDLNSRMRGFAHFALVPLRDQGKAEVLTQRAHTKGYDLPDAVLEYWLRRGPRDLSTLVRDLERLDQATLTHQRLLTVPLLKQVLGY